MRTRAETLPDLDTMHTIALEAFATIPEELRCYVEGVVIRIAEFADGDILADMDIRDPYDLLGLYQGVSLDRKSVSDPFPGVDMIFLYRRPIAAYAEQTGENLMQVIRHVLIHEIGHHFGLSDEDMMLIEEQT
ncbi:MAG: metallopeptidase family protein [Rhodospirillales bacterium]